ncbi:hypothetical protein Tco_0935797 [Tanacetum coccineum]
MTLLNQDLFYLKYGNSGPKKYTLSLHKTSYELGHEHQFITKIVVRRSNGKIDLITEPYYKYLNKNDIEDLYLLCINEKVKDYRETGLLGSFGFARFNTIITSPKALDEGFFYQEHVRKFLRALHPKWRANVMALEESKDLSSLALDELICYLKVHEVIMEKDSKIYKGKKERVKSIALKAKKDSSDDETLTSGSDDEEYAMV